MSTTLVLSIIFYFLGLESMVVDLGHLQRFGVEPLSVAEIFFSCAAASSWSSILTAIFVVVMCYTVRATVTRFYSAFKSERAAVKHARGAHVYNLSRALTLEREERNDLKQTNQALEKAVTNANFDRDSSRREVVNLRNDNSNKAGFIVSLQQNCQEVHALNEDLTDQLQRGGVELAESKAKLQESQRTVVILKEDAEAREIANQTERSSAALINAGNENTILHLQGELRTLKADLQKTKDKLAATKDRKEHYKEAAHDAQARIAESEDQLRAAIDDQAVHVSRAEQAEQATRDAKAEADEARLRARTLQEDVHAGKEREEGLKSQLTVCEIALQRSEARAEGLKADLAGSDVQIEELRAELSSKEVAFEQLSSVNIELRAAIDTVASSSEALVEMCEAKAAEWEKLYNKVLRKNDTMRTYIEGNRVVKQTINTSLESSSSSPSSLVESAEDSDTPSLTFCESDAAVYDSPTQKPAVHYTFTTSTSTELVCSDAGTALIVTASSALSVSHEEPSHDSAVTFIPARHSTPKRSRPSRRPRLSHHGFLHKVKRCEMELPIRPAPIKTSAARPCDLPDIFSPWYRGLDSHQTRFARCLRASPESRDAQQPTVPYPVGCAAARGRILFNRSMKFAETPTVMGRR